eukprot:XP_794125.3 PREDICTED: uncharacterized protein LOC589390 [Strongylocentrotus purpuratus]
MAGSRMNKRFCVIGVALLLATCYGWIRLLLLTFSYDTLPRQTAHHVRFSLSLPQEAEWYEQQCFGKIDEKLSISTLEDTIGRWQIALHPDCVKVFQKFTTIYSISRRTGHVVIPETFQTKVLKWLGNDEELLKEVKLQHITSIFNRYTHESAIFNPLRAKRPGATDPGEDIDQYIEELISSSQNCDFCDFKFKTAEDTFGRIESEHAVTASNTFKYDAYHALIILKSHHPLKFSEEQFLDMFDVAMKWFLKVHSTDKQYVYPHLMWDTLPKASASQIHPHAQASVSSERHYGLMEHIRLSALEYSLKNNGQNYFTDLIQVHNALGLTTKFGEATAMAYLTPKKDYEVMIISPMAGKDFIRLLYYTIRAFIDDLHLYAWSLAIFLPKLEPYGIPKAEDIPAVARIISRGPPTNPRNDISAMELFAASNVNIDPFSVIEHIKMSVSMKGRLQAGDLKKIAERKEQLQHEMDELEKQEEELELKENIEKDAGNLEVGDDGGEVKMVGVLEDPGGDRGIVRRGGDGNGATERREDGLKLMKEQLISQRGAGNDEKEQRLGDDDPEGKDFEGKYLEGHDTRRRVVWPGDGVGIEEEIGDKT